MSTRNITLGVAAAVGVGAGAYFYLNKDKTEEKVKLKNSAFGNQRNNYDNLISSLKSFLIVMLIEALRT